MKLNRQHKVIWNNTKGGNDNPWATSSTSITTMTVYVWGCTPQDAREFIESKWIHTNIQAPISNELISFEKLGSSDQYHFKYKSTVYYN